MSVMGNDNTHGESQQVRVSQMSVMGNDSTHGESQRVRMSQMRKMGQVSRDITPLLASFVPAKGASRVGATKCAFVRSGSSHLGDPQATLL